MKQCNNKKLYKFKTKKLKKKTNQFLTFDQQYIKFQRQLVMILHQPNQYESNHSQANEYQNRPLEDPVHYQQLKLIETDNQVDRAFMIQEQQINQKQKSKTQEQTKQLLQNNYFSDFEYTPCHLIYTYDGQLKNNLFLGDVSSALDLEFINKSNIKTVVTAGAYLDQVSFKNNKDQIKHVIYGVLDHKNQNLIQYFDEFYELVENSFKNGSILVHCAAGISRSSTMVISYLMRKHLWTFKQAIKFVRQKRPNVLPNLGFQRQLKQYQTILIKQQNRKLKSKTSQSKHHYKFSQKSSVNRLRRRKYQHQRSDDQNAQDQQQPDLLLQAQTVSKQKILQNLQTRGLDTRYQFKHNKFVNNFYKNKPGLNSHTDVRRNILLQKSHLFKIKIPTREPEDYKDNRRPQDLENIKSANFLSAKKDENSNLHTPKLQINREKPNSKNIRTSNHHYQQIQDQIKLTPSFVSKANHKKSFVNSFGGLFESAIVSIKYNQSKQSKNDKLLICSKKLGQINARPIEQGPILVNDSKTQNNNGFILNMRVNNIFKQKHDNYNKQTNDLKNSISQQKISNFAYSNISKNLIYHNFNADGSLSVSKTKNNWSKGKTSHQQKLRQSQKRTPSLQPLEIANFRRKY